MINYQLYFILDLTVRHPTLSPIELVEAAISGGVTLIQLRADNWPKKQVYEVARSIKPILDKYAVPLIINNECDIALAIDAAGVHVGQTDLPVHLVRQLLGREKVIGLSISNQAQLEDLATLQLKAKQSNLIWPVNYIGVGPIFATTSKKNAANPLGVQGAEQLLTSQAYLSLNLPAVLIGGINQANLPTLADLPYAGIAVISAISVNEDPEEISRVLKHKVVHKLSLIE